MITKHRMGDSMNKIEARQHLDDNNVVVYFERGLVKFICWKRRGLYMGREYYNPNATPPKLEICINNITNGVYEKDAYVAILGGWWDYFAGGSIVPLYKDIGYYKVFTRGKIQVPRIVQALKEF